MEKTKRRKVGRRLSLFVVAILSCLLFASCAMVVGERGITPNSGELGMGSVESGEFGAAYSIGTTTYNFAYNGTIQELSGIPSGTRLQVELWGARGGSGASATVLGGYGGYSKAEITVTSTTILYVNIGQKGGNGSNGGGGGGGMSDIRLNSTAAGNIIMVSGGGGGGGTTATTNNGGAGGGANQNGQNGGATSNTGGKGGTLSAGGYHGVGSYQTSATKASGGNPGVGGHNPGVTRSAGGGGGYGAAGGAGSGDSYIGTSANGATPGASNTSDSHSAAGGGSNYGGNPTTNAASTSGIGNGANARGTYGAGSGGYGGGGGGGGGCTPAGGGGGGYAGGGGGGQGGGGGGSGFANTSYFTVISGTTGATNSPGGDNGYARITILTIPPTQNSVPSYTAERGTAYTTFSIVNKTIPALNVEDTNTQSTVTSISFVTTGVFTEASTANNAANTGWLDVSLTSTSLTVTPRVLFTNKPFYVLVQNNLGLQRWVQFNLTSTDYDQ